MQIKQFITYLLTCTTATTGAPTTATTPTYYRHYRYTIYYGYCSVTVVFYIVVGSGSGHFGQSYTK